MSKIQNQLIRSFYYIKGALLDAPSSSDLDQYLISYELVKLSNLCANAKPADLSVLPHTFIVDPLVNHRLTRIHKQDVTNNDINWFYKYFHGGVERPRLAI